ncbi:hypothetical protein FJZ36_13600 [Candidatus Poribacteria bacterium]|nr:hypothetical protein [Candidatus Poribacteria bacterium]
MADVLAKIDDIAEPLLIAGDRLNTLEGHKAIAALAEQYCQWGRYAEAAITLREGWVTRSAPDTAACPGRSPFDDDLRRQVDKEWSQNQSGVEAKIASLRNDIEHGGYKRKPYAPADLMDGLEKRIKEFRDASRTK